MNTGCHIRMSTIGRSLTSLDRVTVSSSLTTRTTWGLSLGVCTRCGQLQHKYDCGSRGGKFGVGGFPPSIIDNGVKYLPFDPGALPFGERVRCVDAS